MCERTTTHNTVAASSIQRFSSAIRFVLPKYCPFDGSLRTLIPMPNRIWRDRQGIIHYLARIKREANSAFGHLQSAGNCGSVTDQFGIVAKLGAIQRIRVGPIHGHGVFGPGRLCTMPPPRGPTVNPALSLDEEVQARPSGLCRSLQGFPGRAAAGHRGGIRWLPCHAPVDGYSFHVWLICGFLMMRGSFRRRCSIRSTL